MILQHGHGYMCTPSHACSLATTGEDAITQLCVKANFTRVADFYVIRLSLICIYSVEYSDKIIFHIEYKGAQSRSCTLSKWRTDIPQEPPHVGAVYSDWARLGQKEMFSLTMLYLS